MYDINGDGHISKEEFLKILGSFMKFKGGQITTFSGKSYDNITDICEEFFGTMDRNGDGEISFEEFQDGALQNPDIMKALNII